MIGVLSTGPPMAPPRSAEAAGKTPLTYATVFQGGINLKALKHICDNSDFFSLSSHQPCKHSRAESETPSALWASTSDIQCRVS